MSIFFDIIKCQLLLGFYEGCQIACIFVRYIEALIWPLLVAVGLFSFREPLCERIKKSNVKFTIYGVTIETSAQKLTESLSETFKEELTEKQWGLLEKIHNKGGVSVKKEGLNLSNGGEYFEWVRPIRNAGLIKTLPEGYVIELSERLVLTKLGDC